MTFGAFSAGNTTLLPEQDGGEKFVPSKLAVKRGTQLSPPEQEMRLPHESYGVTSKLTAANSFWQEAHDDLVGQENKG